MRFFIKILECKASWSTPNASAQAAAEHANKLLKLVKQQRGKLMETNLDENNTMRLLDAN